ncbi:hypothetical protein FLK61_31940 [Paenalkalicoccus suaedae]|uniref:Uncharacterized protein n=1 Tax=Paenalkalicoccus suaedae TaxID=2592382 RepID=A0A859FEH5_9BACI|nr:hypothetical protein [Paenalkalicoccus suaedae]QKS71321.1 hypothetical protein FLK61_31940 [Paenalkalicoccus suaedae]
MKLTEQEENFIETYIVLTLSRAVLERDLKLVDKSPFKIKEAYEHLLHLSLQEISKQLYQVRMHLEQQQITIQSSTRDKTFSEYTVVVRNYVVTIKYVNVQLRQRVRFYLEKLFTGSISADFLASEKQLAHYREKPTPNA